jgi:transposase
MTRPALQVKLSPEEDNTLLELSGATSVGRRPRRRAEMLRLSHRGWSTLEIASYFDCRVETVREAIYRWREGGIGGLWDEPRAGRPRQWESADLAYLEAQLSKPGSLNSRQLIALLKQERNVVLSRRHLSRLLKKKGSAGSAPGTVIAKNKTRLPEAKNKLS